MTTFVGYIIFFLLIVVLILLFLIVIQIEKKIIQNQCAQEKQKAIIIKKALMLYNNIYKKQEEYKEYQALFKYIRQLFLIVNEDSSRANIFNFDEFSFVSMQEYFENLDKKNSTVQYQKQFISEYNKAPNEIRKNIDMLAQIIDQIFSLKHPLKHKFMHFKKNLLLQILKYIVKFLDFVAKISKTKVHTTVPKVNDKLSFKDRQMLEAG